MIQQCKTQADCFRELARVMDMCKGTNVKWRDAIKNLGYVWSSDRPPRFDCPTQWSFAVAIVEDRPVFAPIAQPADPQKEMTGAQVARWAESLKAVK